MSASQICIASSAALPIGASPPVSAMPKPMVIGFSRLRRREPAGKGRGGGEGEAPGQHRTIPPG